MHLSYVRWIWILNLLATVYMIGLIWFVQIVHYPLKAFVDKKQYTEYQQKHMVRTTTVVAVPMVIEAITAGYLAYAPPGFGPEILWQGGFILVLVNLGSTYFLQKPAHETLLNGYQSSVHRSLVITNWIRTTTWTARGLLWMILLLYVA